tara:strand:- start:685 stop:1239 length:555 start_codon:yes stop_codon:yes gene_type:complete
LIKTVYILAFFCCQLLANDKINSSVSFEYWISEDFKLFSLEDVLSIEIEDGVIEISAKDWFGEILLNEDIEYENQNLTSNNLIASILKFEKITEEDIWLDKYVLLDEKVVSVRYLFSEESGGLRLYRLDIKQENNDSNDDTDNTINDVILNNDVIMIWADLDNNIMKVGFVYNSLTYVIEKNEN